MIFQFLQGLMLGVPSQMIVLVDIGLMIIIATFLAYLARITRQPFILAYIIAGILIGPSFFNLIENQDLIRSLSEIGVAFLIFTAGLEIKFKKLKEVGRVSTIGGVLQIIIMFLLGFLFSLILGVSGKIPIYVGLVVAFSSTMIVVKLLADKKEINSLHGRIIIGILLMQDIVAIVALAILSSDFTIFSIFLFLLKTVLFGVFAIFLSRVINPLLKTSADNHELLLLVSISFLFLFSIGAFMTGLSLIIGAFFAGVALANSDYKTEIQGKVGPLREFFSVIFFVALGMQIVFISNYLPFSSKFVSLFIVILLLVFIIKPLLIMFLIRIFGFKKRTSFLTGNSLAQTSEFSLIIAMLGLSLGHIDQGFFNGIVILTVLTMSLTTYLITYEKKLGRWLDWPLNIMDRFHTKKEELEYIQDSNEVILFGCHRMGSLVLKDFKKEKNILVVDYNPEIIRSLISKKVPCIYGDYINDEVLNKINLKEAELIISTVPDFDDNKMLIEKIRKINKKTSIFVIAERISQALELYKSGADFVILPNVLGGQRASELIKKEHKSKTSIREMRKEHIKYLNSIHHILY